MKIKTATLEERDAFLQGDQGYVCRNHTGPILGHIAHTIQDSPLGPIFYVHSLRAGGPPETAAMLIQAARRTARRQGFKKVDFCVGMDLPALLKFASNGRATIKQIWMETKA